MGEIIKVGMADWKVCNPPDGLITIGLGSCMGVVIYDTITRISGMAHIMLPDSTAIAIKSNQNRAKFADTGIEDTLNALLRKGVNRRTLLAKIAGGAQMFSFGGKGEDLCQIGLRNAEAVKKKLREYNIRIVAEDTGGTLGRTITFFSDSFDLQIKVVGKEIKVI